MGKGDEERMWEGNYFFIHFILVMKKKHFSLVSFFKQSEKDPLLILCTIKMKVRFRKLVLLLPSLHQLHGYPTCGVWTSFSKVKIHSWQHRSSQPLGDCCAVCLLQFLIMSKNNEKQSNI